MGKILKKKPVGKVAPKTTDAAPEKTDNVKPSNPPAGAMAPKFDVNALLTKILTGLNSGFMLCAAERSRTIKVDENWEKLSLVGVMTCNPEDKDAAYDELYSYLDGKLDEKSEELLDAMEAAEGGEDGEGEEGGEESGGDDGWEGEEGSGEDEGGEEGGEDEGGEEGDGEGEDLTEEDINGMALKELKELCETYEELADVDTDQKLKPLRAEIIGILFEEDGEGEEGGDDEGGWDEGGDDGWGEGEDE